MPLALLLAVVLFAAAQLVPYRVRNHPAVAAPNWDSPQTQRLFAAACADCHTNTARSHWYEKVAPVSWWIANHVDDGRAALNMSVCRQGEGRREGGEAVLEGSMPPAYYSWFGLHPDARLTAQQRRDLADGLAATAARGCRTLP